MGNGLPVLLPEALTIIAVGGALIALVGLLVAVFAFRAARRAQRQLDAVAAHYQLVMSGAEGQDLAAALAAFAQRLAAGESRLGQLESRSDDLDSRVRKAVTHLTLLRFKAFEDGGGDQSFVLALLNEAADGAVVSGIHGRGGIRIYAKPVTAGDSAYNLSAEESQAIAGSSPAGQDG